MRRRMVQAVYLAALAGTAPHVHAANLLANSEFDTDLSGWSVLTGNAEWSAEDCCGSPASGSASLPIVDAGHSIVASDCVAVDPGAAYDLVLFAETLSIPPGFLDGHGTASVWWFRSGEACLFASEASGNIEIPAANGWRSFGSTMTAPDDAVSARVALTAEIAGLSVAIDAHFDHVLFGPTGSVPVTLESFVVD